MTPETSRKRSFLILLICLSFCTINSLTMRGANFTNTPRFFSLRQVVDLALKQSPTSRNAVNQRENSFWQYRNFNASFRPSLYLNGNLPDFRSLNTPVTQPDGSIVFHNINLSQSSARLALNQVIAATGATIYVASDLMRIDDFERHSVAYNSSPLIIGLQQPIFGFNDKRWSKKIEPLRYEESKKAFDEGMEQISYTATLLFFDLLNIQTDAELSQSNLKNSQSNLEIAKIKKSLGKLSENDYERINLSVFNAKKAMNRASMERKTAEFNLKSFIGSDQSESLQLITPLEIPRLTIDVQKALQQANLNRKETPQLKRMLLEAERDKTQAKRNSGLNAYLNATYGLTNTGNDIGRLYDRPEVQKMVQLSFNIPVIDWGRSASRVKMAESKNELVKYEVNQQSQQFEREVIVQAEQFMLLYEQIETSQQADKVAENGYQIALKQYQNGNLSITDLNIALQEREQSRRDYINSLAEFWKAYYKIRILTLYDFENDKTLRTSDTEK